MGDRVAVLADGVLQQCAPPRELYRTPANVFVAGFVGSPAMNLFTLPVCDGAVSLGDWVIRLPRECGDAAQLTVGVRPEHLEFGERGVAVTVDVVEELGADAYVYGRITAGGNALGEPVVARVDGQSPPRRGQRVRLHPDVEQLHFFDADGRRIGTYR